MHLSQPARFTREALLAISLCILPVLAFYVLLWREARSVPMYDDFHAIVDFALRLQDRPSASAKLLYLIAAQHDEYKLIVEHIIVASDIALTGHIHFGLLILLGDILVLGVAWLLWRNTPKSPHLAFNLLLFAPVVFLLFQLNYVENLDWAMCGLQTMPVIFFALCSLHLLFRKRQPADEVSASLCALLACLSSANGFLLAPIALIVLTVRRHWSALVAWIACIALGLAMYLYRYEPFHPYTTTEHVKLGSKILFFSSFLGSAAENMHHYPVKNASVLLGAGIIAVILFAWRAGRHHAQPFVLSLASWCILSGVVVAQTRSYQGITLSLTGRYKIYSDLLLISCYLLWANHLRTPNTHEKRNRVLYTAVLTSCIALCIGSDVFGYRFLARRQARVQQGLNQYAADPAHNPPEISLGGEPFAGPEPEISRALLTEAIQRGLYHLPPPSQR